jgi:hypothetical protein
MNTGSFETNETNGRSAVPARKRPAVALDQPPPELGPWQVSSAVPAIRRADTASSVSEAWDDVPPRSRRGVRLGLALLGLVGVVAVVGTISREAWHGRLAAHATAVGQDLAAVWRGAPASVATARPSAPGVPPLRVSAPVVSAPVVSAPIVSAPVVSAPVVSAPVVSGPVSPPGVRTSMALPSDVAPPPEAAPTLAIPARHHQQRRRIPASDQAPRIHLAAAAPRMSWDAVETLLRGTALPVSESPPRTRDQSLPIPPRVQGTALPVSESPPRTRDQSLSVPPRVQSPPTDTSPPAMSPPPLPIPAIQPSAPMPAGRDLAPTASAP